MSDTNELIVAFTRGISEETARAAVEAAGASVRRRMRTDHADEVMLLVRAEDIGALEKVMKGRPDVRHTERNSSDYEIS